MGGEWGGLTLWGGTGFMPNLLTQCTLPYCLLDASYTTYIHNYETGTNRLELAEYLVDEQEGGWTNRKGQGHGVSIG